MQKKKRIENIVAVLLILVLGMMSAAAKPVVYAEENGKTEVRETHDGESAGRKTDGRESAGRGTEVRKTDNGESPGKEIVEETTNLETEEPILSDPLELGESIMQYIGHKRADIVNYEPKSRTVNGQIVNIRPGTVIHYGNWLTNEFSVDGKYLGYCAEPDSATPSGNFTAYELNNDMVKVCLMCAPGGPLDGKIGGFPAGSIFYDTNVPGGNRYANAHAAIGYVYTGSLTGLSSSYAAGIKNFVQMAANVKNNGTGNYDAAAAWDAWKVMIAPNNNQDIVWLEGVPRKGRVKLTKTSANVEMTKDNLCYSMAGAVYGVWKNTECTQDTGLRFQTNANGEADLNGTLDAGTYYVKEIKAPPGYALDATIYQVNVKANETAVLDVQDTPQNNPIEIILAKIDKETNADEPQGKASLENAEFEVKYYKGHYENETALQGINAERSWIVKTDKKGIALLSEEYKVSGDAFYENTKGKITLPLGTVSIREIKSPEGYLLNEEVFLRQIVPEGTAEEVRTYQHPIIPETVLKLHIVKKLKDTEVKIPGVKFAHTLPDGTTEIVITDANGETFIKGLTRGIHTIEEVFVPDGYMKNPGKITFQVNEKNEIVMTENTALPETGKMEFSVGKDKGGELIVEDVYAPYGLQVVKKNESEKALSGAEFTIYSDGECTKEIARGTTAEDGTVTFENLEVEKKYYLKETKAPAGYRIPVKWDGSAEIYEFYTKSNPAEDVFEYYVNETKQENDEEKTTVVGTKANRIVLLKIVNHTGNRLPKTGTYGTPLMYVTGICCMTGALGYAVRKKRGNRV